MIAAAVTMMGLAAPCALGQRTMQFDVNGLDFQARNSAGAPAPFGGVTHTGSFVLNDVIPPSLLVDLAIRAAPGAPFLAQPSQNMTDFTMVINLSSGNVTGGTLSIDINGGPSGGGDRYSASLSAAGGVEPFVGGGFMIEGLSTTGMFSDALFGPIDIADFVEAEGGAGLNGSFLAFRINPDATGAGNADIDAFVTAPTPGAAVCLGLGGLVALRRRRR
jgi:MYXO-CTERM domain-containing protein